MKKLLIIFSVLVFIVFAVCFAAYKFIYNPLAAQTIEVDGIQRGYKCYVPENLKEKPGVLFVIHGSMGTPEIMRVSTGKEFDRLADESKNMIIVYPQGFEKYWNDCRKVSNTATKLKHLNDVGFIEKIIDKLDATYKIDRTKVFATGFSNGGQMCYKLAFEKPNLFKGVAAISANLPVDANNDCLAVNQPINILVMNGTGDPINPYFGGNIPDLGDGVKRGAVISTGQNVMFWRHIDRCDSVANTGFTYPHRLEKNDDGTHVERRDYEGPITNKKVVLISIINGGHVVPNPNFKLWPKKLGIATKDIDAPKVIWDFFMNECK